MERLRAPVSWWGLGMALVATTWAVLQVATPWWAAAAGALMVAVATASSLVAAGSLEVGVRAGEVVAGRAHVGLDDCGAVTPLDADGTRRLRGPDADATAFLVLRPWVATAVRVDITDPADPTPYWLVSTRHPEHVAAAARIARRQPPPSGRDRAR